MGRWTTICFVFEGGVELRGAWEMLALPKLTTISYVGVLPTFLTLYYKA